MRMLHRARQFAQAVRKLPANAVVTLDLVTRLADDRAGAVSPVIGDDAAVRRLADQLDRRRLDELAQATIRYAPSLASGTTVATTTNDDPWKALTRARAATADRPPLQALVLAPGCTRPGQPIEQLDSTGEILRIAEPVGWHRSAVLLAASAQTSHVLLLDPRVEPASGAVQDLLAASAASGADLVCGHVSEAGVAEVRRHAPRSALAVVSVAAVHDSLATCYWSAFADQGLDEAFASAGRTVVTLPRLLGVVTPPG